ncbi:MAG: hypothetical protein IT281_02420, partial [Ignavibacteria bacterium]|nr:hypothetical protein [Ignavibacteria bacterium]
MTFIRKILTIVMFVFSLHAYSQGCYDLNFQLQSEISSTCFNISMTMLHDQNDRPYLYIANKEGGLKIYDVSVLSAPKEVKTIPISSLNNLHVMNLTQSGNYLYLALGNHFTSSQSPGMAIIDITDPKNAAVAGKWKFSKNDGGAGVVKVQGDYAFLGAMKHGLIILDISNIQDIKFISQFVPDVNFPDKKPDKKKINARGMQISGDLVYLCYDAGGFRTINVSNKQNPFEAGRYSNPALSGKPRAYNNVVVDGAYAYVTADYCGLEVLNISDPGSIKMVSWWNPYNCQDGLLKWFSSPGHMNEIDYNKECKLLFMSSGKSDLHVLNVSNPNKPDSCAYYGGVNNDIGTWGVSSYKNQ